MTATFEEARDIEQRGLEDMLKDLNASGWDSADEIMSWLEGYVIGGEHWKIDA